jgi:hypothetical protein
VKEKEKENKWKREKDLRGGMARWMDGANFTFSFVQLSLSLSSPLSPSLPLSLPHSTPSCHTPLFFSPSIISFVTLTHLHNHTPPHAPPHTAGVI